MTSKDKIIVDLLQFETRMTFNKADYFVIKSDEEGQVVFDSIRIEQNGMKNGIKQNLSFWSKMAFESNFREARVDNTCPGVDKWHCDLTDTCLNFEEPCQNGTYAKYKFNKSSEHTVYFTNSEFNQSKLAVKLFGTKGQINLFGNSSKSFTKISFVTNEENVTKVYSGRLTEPKIQFHRDSFKKPIGIGAVIWQNSTLLFVSFRKNVRKVGEVNFDKWSKIEFHDFDSVEEMHLTGIVNTMNRSLARLVKLY